MFSAWLASTPDVSAADQMLKKMLVRIHPLCQVQISYQSSCFYGMCARVSCWYCNGSNCMLQIEEAYIGADQFCSLVRQDSQSVLRNELNVLHGLKFDLITHPPLRAMQGFFQAQFSPLLLFPHTVQYSASCMCIAVLKTTSFVPCVCCVSLLFCLCNT